MHAPAGSSMPPDAGIRQILAARSAESLGTGMVAGAADAKGRRIAARGSLAKDQDPVRAGWQDGSRPVSPPVRQGFR